MQFCSVLAWAWHPFFVFSTKLLFFIDFYWLFLQYVIRQSENVIVVMSCKMKDVLRRALCLKTLLSILSSKKELEGCVPDVKHWYRFHHVFSSNILNCIGRQLPATEQGSTKHIFSFGAPDLDEMTKYLIFYVSKHNSHNLLKNSLCCIREMTEWKVLKYVKRRGLGSSFENGRKAKFSEGFEGRLITTLGSVSSDEPEGKEEERRWQEAGWELYQARGNSGFNTVFPV